MPILAGRRQVSVSFSDFSGGVNFSEDSTRINKNQVQDTLNAILRKNGALKRPGTASKASFDLTAPIKGFHNYLDFDGNEELLIGSDGILYKIAASNGADTELYDIGGSGNFSFTDALGRCWLTNGTDVVKYDGTTVEPVSIETPTGFSAAMSAGGTIPDGDYEVYLGFARNVGGTNVLYSAAQYLGTKTAGSGNNTLTITVPAEYSDDTSINRLVLWMSQTDLATIYYNSESGSYPPDAVSSTTWDVSSLTINESIVYSAVAVNNYPCPEFSQILSHDGRLWGVSTAYPNRVYYSLRNTSNPYDLEKWYPLNFIDYPYSIIGIFAIGTNLYINTPAGIIVQEESDVTARYSLIEKRWRFKYMSTVVDYNGGKLGLTNDGIKFFDGEKFYDYDLSEAVKSEISKIYNTTSGFDPCGIIYRRDIRTEYHLSYCDDNVNTITNNRRLVLNLDKLQFITDKAVIAPFELWSNGATHMAANQDGLVYHIQSHATAPKMYIETTNNAVDNGIYLDDESIGDSDSAFNFFFCTRTELLDMSSRNFWSVLRTMALVSTGVTIEIHIRDVENRLSSNLLESGSETALWDVFLWDEANWASSVPELRKTKLPANLHGYMIYAKAYQTADDKDLNILNITVEGIGTRTRFT